MRKPALYSQTVRRGPAVEPRPGQGGQARAAAPAETPGTAATAGRGWRSTLSRAAVNPRVMWAALALLSALLLLAAGAAVGGSCPVSAL